VRTSEIQEAKLSLG